MLQSTGCGQDASSSHGATAAAMGHADLASSPEPLPGGSGSATVTYQPNVHVVDQKVGANALVGESSNGHGLVFDASSPEINSLKDGDVLVIKGLIARKILGVDHSGGQVLVLTDQATLGDVIKEGALHLAAPIKFGTLHAQREPRRSWTDLFESNAYADTRAAAGASRDAVGNLVKGAGKYAVADWKISNWSATPVGDRLNIDLDMTKEAKGDFKAIVGVHGHITNFNLIDDLKASAAGAEMSATIKDLTAEMTFTWEVGKGSPGPYSNEDRIKLPAVLSVPLAQYLGGLPVFLEISAALVVHPALTGGSEIAKGALKLTYSGGVGISGAGGDVNATSSGDGAVEVTDDSGLSPVAPVGMVLVVAAPRIELSLGLKKIFPIADKVDAALATIDKRIDAFAKQHLSPEAYDALAKSPLGTAVASNIIKSQADVFAQLVVTAGVTRTGSTALIQCSRITTSLTAQIGMNGSLFGVNAGAKETTKDVLTHQWLRVEPPGAKPCADMN